MRALEAGWGGVVWKTLGSQVKNVSSRYSAEDASHQSIALEYGKPYNTYTIKEAECVVCNLCQLICPVTDCITMVEQRAGKEYVNWKDFQRLGMKLNDH